MTNLALWQPDTGELLPKSAKAPVEIASYAQQLNRRDKQQVVAAFDGEHYEMGVNFLWGKTLHALMLELSTVGVGLLGEMLGRPDVSDEDAVEDVLTARDAIRLAEELGVVSSTDAMRLRHTHELVTHFSQMDYKASETEEIDQTEALAALKTCIKAVLGRPSVEVAGRFVDFREALEGRTIEEGDPYVDMLEASPYFFLKLTVSVLANGSKKNAGANLEHTLANINVLIPAIWPRLRDTERWQVGHAYADAFASGRSTAVSGIKSALSKVQGFDYVPESLRSDTFVKAAEAILRAHDGANNFYNEAAPVKGLAKLGTTIPAPALPACITALLSVVLGNYYGVAWSAEPEASRLLGRLSPERWAFYINNALASDTRILSKLIEDKPRANWIRMAAQYEFADIQVKDHSVDLLIKATTAGDHSKIIKRSQRLVQEYYGRSA